MSGYAMCELCDWPITDEPFVAAPDGRHVAHESCVDDLAARLYDEWNEQRIGESR